MLAAQISENSEDLSTIQLKTVDIPTASAGYAVVRVHAASINPIDILVAKGIAKNAFGWEMPLPFTVGYDFSGVVESVDGADSDKFPVGTPVFAVNWGIHNHGDTTQAPIGGAFAEFIRIPINKISKVPAGLTHEQAAALALVGTTANQILFDCAKVTAGSKVLILGGATAVGHLAIQLAKAKGAWVATTSSTRNLGYVAQFGADLVVNYTEQKWDEMAELKGVDAVLDCVGEQGAWARTTGGGVVKADGAFVSISSPDVGFDPAGHAPMHFASMYVLKNSPTVQDELGAMVAEGRLKLSIAQTFPFTQEGVTGIVNAVASASSQGKNVLKMI